MNPELFIIKNFKPIFQSVFRMFQISFQNSVLYGLVAFMLLFPFSNIFRNISWAASDQTHWGGQIKLQGAASWHDNNFIHPSNGSEPYYDGDIDFRLKNKTYFSDHIYSTIHYEAVFKGGDTERQPQILKQVYPDKLQNPTVSTPEDDNRFFDLTKIIHQKNNYTIYHRLDRMSLTFQPEWGTIRIGRQAVTWGNGLVFNPMDLFNPFAPTDIERDYKTGGDMIYTQIPWNNSGDFQFLYVPGRNTINQNIEYSSSSLAGKLHTSLGDTDVDIMVAHHYTDRIIGLGSTGYVMNAAWRMDATWTFLDKDADKNNFLSLIANMDYSWVWLNRNIYGFVEFYFNGAGDENYAAAVSDPEIIDRITRGDIFVFGRRYLAMGTQIEIHPLFHVYLNIINNISDPSGIIQPRSVWDITENLQCTLGGNFYYGGSETEFGGFTIKGTDDTYKPADNMYLWMTYFF